MHFLSRIWLPSLTLCAIGGLTILKVYGPLIRNNTLKHHKLLQSLTMETIAFRLVLKCKIHNLEIFPAYNKPVANLQGYCMDC